MHAAWDHIRIHHPAKRQPWQRRHWRLLAILMGVLLLQSVPNSSGLPLGLPGSTTAQAAGLWYVDQGNSSASDSINSCASSSSPCKTIGGALVKAAAGDTVNINPGTYYEHLTLGQNVTLVGADPRTTFIDGSTSGTVVTVNAGVAATIQNLTIRNGNSGFGPGGGILSSGNLTVLNSTISNNLASGPDRIVGYGGGGIAVQSGTATITGSTIENNSTNAFGAGINAGLTPAPAGSTTTTIVNSTIAGNTDSTGGGGTGIITWAGANLNVVNSTIANNTGSSTGGDSIYNYGTTNIKNTLLAGNPGGCRNDTNTGYPAGVMNDAGYNLEDGTGCGFSASTSKSSTVPLLASPTPASNGGSTDTFALQSGSPAIGAGSCTDLSGNAVHTDQRGLDRPASGCTIGAWELDGNYNDTWVKAITLGDTFPHQPPYQVGQTMNQYIFTSTQERWYRFPVTPGSTVHVQYTGLPGAIVTLHSDLQSAYNSITNPQSAAVQSATNNPSGFLPQQFLPQQFLPQQFLPQQFLPQQFLPQQFLPQQFLPQQFLPQQFLPQQFLPQQFLPGPYSGAIYASLLAISATPNTSVQTIDHNTWNAFGYMYVRVVAPPSASTTFQLTVIESGGVCAGVHTIPFTAPTSNIPTGLKSLILWDPARISGSSTDISTLGSKLSTFAIRPDVQGALVDLSQIAGIDGSGSAQEQADNNPACPMAKNLVANDIKSVIGAYRARNSGLQNIVLVGDDHSIPFFRYPDESGLGLENQYYPPVADSSSSNAGLRNNEVLGQDEYGSSLTLPMSATSLPIPDLAVGRLVKTAAEVSHMLDVYTAGNGTITPSSSLVTGYDFVADAATNAQNELQLGTGTTPDTLISPQGQSPSTSWTASDLRGKLFGSRHDVVFLAGHFSAGALEAADYATTVSASDVASSSVDLSNSLVLGLGCHGGYNIPGGDGVPNVSPAPDWPEAMAQKGATFLSATGYAYGDTVLTEYGEHLFDNYVRQLRSYPGAVGAGQAEVAAKKEYLATHTNLSGVDEKTLLETTLYGLPMLQVNMPGQHLSPQSDPSIVTSTSSPINQFGLVTGNGSSDVIVHPTLTSHTVNLTNNATNTQVATTYFTAGPNNTYVARPGEPIFPSQSFNVHVPSMVLRGVGFRGGTYSDSPNVTPLTSAVGTETSVGHPAFYTNVFYPTQVGTGNYFDALGGGSERLDTTPAQYLSSSPSSTSGTMRQFSDLQFRLFYLPNNWTTQSSQVTQAAEAAPPQITDVSATSSGGSVTFSVHVLSDQLAGTQGVWITYTDSNHPNTWQSIDLGQSGSDPTLWTATQTLGSNLKFMVQAASGTGLVTLSTNSGAYYTGGAPPASTTPTSVTIQSAPSSGTYQTTSGTFQVQVGPGAGSGSSPLSGQPVTLQVGGQQALGTLDSNGNASITLPLNQPPSSYTVVATFAGGTVGGTTYQASSSAAGTFAITPAPTALSLSTPSVIYGSPATLTATLTDTSGSGLVQRTVVFTVMGNGTTLNKTAITDYLGRALLGSLSLPPGNYSVTASFGGADHPVQLSVGGTTVTESDPNYLTSTAGPSTLSITYLPATTNGVTNSCDGSPEHAILQPVNPDGSSVFKQGSTVPLKFRVCDVNGNSVGPNATASTVVTSFTSVKAVTNCSSCSVDESIYSTTPDTAFRWDATGQQWIFNLSTKNLVSGTTYYYDIALNDGTHIYFHFAVK